MNKIVRRRSYGIDDFEKWISRLYPIDIELKRGNMRSRQRYLCKQQQHKNAHVYLRQTKVLITVLEKEQ